MAKSHTNFALAEVATMVFYPTLHMGMISSQILQPFPASVIIVV
jgi:hypothetical protein